MRVLVTGSSGHVGKAIAAHLAQRGEDVIGLGRHGGGDAGDGVTVDLSRPDAWGRLADVVPAVDAMVHAAASRDVSPGAPDIALVNCCATQALADLAVARDARLVFISGVSVIGSPRRLPIGEDHPAGPLTPYHASKLFGEHVTAHAGWRGIPAASLRLSAPVGPGIAPERVLSVFAARAANGETLRVAGRGTRRQDYVDVRDVASAVTGALEREASGVFNVAAGVSVSNEELARRCVEVTSSASEVVVGETPDPADGERWEVSIDRARRELGWEPGHGLDDAIHAALGQ